MEARSTDKSQASTPVGGGNYEVQPGDCLSSIASTHGLFWQTIWNHPANQQLKALRKDPNVLLPGDLLFIPDRQQQEQDACSEKRHRFCKKGVPAKLRLRLLKEDGPRAGERYSLVVDGRLLSGVTDGDGRIEQSILPDAAQAILRIGRDEYTLKLGCMDPIDAITGVQARLNNLGFSCGPRDGQLGPRTEAAVRQFQRSVSLAETGKLDDATRQRLKQAHGS